MFFFHIGNSNPNWLSYFSEGLKPPPRRCLTARYTEFFVARTGLETFYNDQIGYGIIHEYSPARSHILYMMTISIIIFGYIYIYNIYIYTTYIYIYIIHDMEYSIWFTCFSIRILAPDQWSPRLRLGGLRHHPGSDGHLWVHQSLDGHVALVKHWWSHGGIVMGYPGDTEQP
jgi:hypothetical protein